MSGVSDDVVLRELGLLPMTKATHVLILSTAGFTPKVRATVRNWMRESSVAVYLFGDKEYDQLKRDPGAIPAIVAAQSRQIARLERSGL